MFGLKYNIKAQVYSQCGYNSLIIHFPDTANGVIINEISTEPTQYSSLFTTDTTTYCGILCGTFQVGYSGAFTQTLTFSSPVNNVVYIVMGSDSVSGGAVESFSFTVNTGTLSCTQVNSSSSSYLYTQHGNLFTSNSSPPVNGHSNGAYITLNSTMPYNTIKVQGTGGNAGSFMSLCANSINTAGINNVVSKAQNINLYPNPNNGSMMLDYNIKDDARLEMTDITGNLVGTYNLPATGNTLQMKNDNLQNGVYLYRVISNNAVIKQGKIVVMK